MAPARYKLAPTRPQSCLRGRASASSWPRGSTASRPTTSAGEQHISDHLHRGEVRRTRSARNGYRFTLGLEIPCPAGTFTCWITVRPHADHMRLLPPTDAHFDRLYGLRNDSESNNQAYKRTLPHRRAAGLGWRRQLLDAVGWAILVNARALALHGPDGALPPPIHNVERPSPLDQALDQEPVTAAPATLGRRILAGTADRIHQLAANLDQRAHG